MALFFYEHEALSGSRNFGDDLNPWLMRELFGEQLLSSPSDVVVGIGTLLNDVTEDTIRAFRRKMVFSSGVGYGSRPLRPDASWSFFAVRGQFTRDALGLGSEIALGDGAMLLPDYSSSEIDPKTGSGLSVFMPHIDMENSFGVAWRRAALISGLHYLSPAESRRVVISTLCNARLVITASMHGAIVADALRTPWIALDLPEINQSKWHDWASAVDLDLEARAISSIGLRDWQSPFQRADMHLKTLVVAGQLRNLRSARGQLSGLTAFRNAQRGLRDAAKRLVDVIAVAPSRGSLASRLK